MLNRVFLSLHICLAELKDCVISLLCSNRASAKLPKHILDELARCFLPDIQAFYESPEGRKEYEDWKVAQTQQTPQNAAQSP